MDANSNTDFKMYKTLRKGVPLYDLCLYTKGMKQSLRMLITKDNAVCAHTDGEPKANGFVECRYITPSEGVDILERYFADLIKSLRADVLNLNNQKDGN